MKQIKLTTGPLLDNNGEITESGYATTLIKDYDRKMIKARKLRIKEWDYYYVGNNHIGVALTIADNSYMGLYSVSLLNFDEKSEITKSVMTFMPKGKTNLPSTSTTGDVKFENKKLKIYFKNTNGNRKLECTFKNFNHNEDLNICIVLESSNTSMVIVTPFDKPKHFYYNQKINCLKATGYVTLGDKHYNLDNSYGVLDWGRGVWTYKNTWYWSSASGEINNKTIGFNLGYGFGNNQNATENMFFYDNECYKLDEVTFNIPKSNGKEKYLDKWTFTSNDNALYLEFTPILNRNALTNLLVLKTDQNQVFGYFNGYIMANDRKIEINNLLGFAEKVTNWY